MTEEEAKAEALKRNKNKSKHLHRLRWVAVHVDRLLTDGWKVELKDTSEVYAINPTTRRTRKRTVAVAARKLSGSPTKDPR